MIEVDSECEEADLVREDICISSDFSRTLLQKEARRLEIDPNSYNKKELLGAVYNSMEAQHFSKGNINDAPS